MREQKKGNGALNNKVMRKNLFETGSFLLIELLLIPILKQIQRSSTILFKICFAPQSKEVYSDAVRR